MVFTRTTRVYHKCSARLKTGLNYFNLNYFGLNHFNVNYLGLNYLDGQAYINIGFRQVKFGLLLTSYKE